MNSNVLLSNKGTLARGAAILMLAGLSAGCSASATRFGGGLDGTFTASTKNQRAIISQESQPFPEQAAPAQREPEVAVSAAAPGPAPVTRSQLPAATGAAARPEKPQPVQAASLPAGEDSPGTASPKGDRVVARPVAAGEEPAGWSRAGGTEVTAKDGETVFNLSRRFGVPADVIIKVNGLADNGGLQSGQKVIIPTYVYTSKAPVSSPDSNPKVADAKSSRGSKIDVPADKVPAPGDKGKVAVLPQQPKVREGEAAASTDAAPAKSANTYKVAEGDSLSKIARKTGVDVAALKKANGLQDGILRIGQTLKIPGKGAQMAKASAVDAVTTGTTGPAKKAGEAPQVASYTPPKKSQVTDAVEQDQSSAPNATGIGRMRWPVRGRVIADYGKGGSRSNDGIDIQVPEGTPVKAAENGVVIYAGDGLKEFGNTVLVRHENGLVTVYGHASALKVERGQKVKRGQEIALSGMSGSTDAPKLHFEVRKNSAPVDPASFLE